jgi:CRISPR/Cas system-associated exonuclease Cas4 (RecB family)
MTSAGEVEQYAYCAHNWWLAQQGKTGEGAGSKRGVSEHKRLGGEQLQAEGDKRDIRQGFQWSFRLLLVACSLTLLALELVFLRAHPQHILFLTMGLVMVSASAGSMVIALDAQKRLKATEAKGEIITTHPLLDSDLAGGGTTLQDPAWDLTGTPDYVLDTPGGPVPVEVKTGHTPAKPYPNHVLQVSCYLRLLEANGKAPPYGLVNYPDGVFRVAWGEPQKADLRAVLDRIAAARREGKADRDHEQPGRCRGCARRDACEQRLA